MYVVVRRDMPIGVQMAQACHAAFSFAQTHPAQTADWHRTSQYLVIVSVANEVELHCMAVKATNAHIRHVDWYEPDMDDQFTALALAPGKASAKLCANLPLAGRLDTAASAA